MIHTWSWIAWLAATLVLLSSTRNPLYLVLILLSLAIISNTLTNYINRDNNSNSGAGFPISPLRIGITLITLSALFNAAVSHYGETVIFHLPEWIPILGGAVTSEGLVFGAINGLVLFGIFWAFMIFNQALPSRKMLRLIPRAFYPLAVTTSIAISFLPTTIRHFHQIREAQAIRGHKLKGIRDWLPLVMPLMIGGLERAMSLAEAMTARGFASTGNIDGQDWPRVGLLIGILFLLAGWIIRMFDSVIIFGNIVIIAGSAIILGTLWIAGRRKTHTTFEREHWKIKDGIIILGASLLLSLFLLTTPIIDRQTLLYETYPQISLPGFDPLIGILLLLITLPALFYRNQST